MLNKLKRKGLQIADLRRRNFKSIRSMSEFQFDHLRRYWRKVCNGNSAMEITGLLRLRKECTILHGTAFDRERKILIKSFKEVMMVVMAYSPVPNEMNLMNQSND